MFLQQIPDSHGFLDEVQILPLKIFYQGCKTGGPVIHTHENAGDIGDTCQLRGPEPPFATDQLVSVSLPPDRQGLQDSMLADGVRQLIQSGFLKNLPGLGRIGPDRPDRKKYHPSRLHIGFQLLAMHCPSSLENK